MIPILYESNETAFESNGIGRLSDCITFTVTEERNGIYEAEFEYPVGGIHFEDITPGRIVAVIHDDNKDIQPFDIYRKEEPIDGIVKFNAHHISYRLNENATAPFTASIASDALAGLGTNAYLPCPFTFATNKTTATAFELTEPTTIRAALGGVDGSILDVYGGEFQFDKFSVILWNRRGSDKDVQIRYGSNLTDYTDETDFESVYNAVIPYWAGSDSETNEEVVIIGSIINSGHQIDSGRTALMPLDLSGEFKTTPTVPELNSAASARVAAGMPWLPSENITLSFVPLWNSTEYSGTIPAQRLALCDTAPIYFEAYNKAARMKVVRTVYNVLLERYDEMEFGNLQTTLSEAVTAKLASTVAKQRQDITTVGQIAGNTTQHFWFNSNGTDTGAHITEVDRDTFEADPANGGPNFLARTNGLAIRDGLIELATFSETSAVIGALGAAHITTSTTGIDLYDYTGVKAASFNSNSATIGPDVSGYRHITLSNTDGLELVDSVGTTEAQLKGGELTLSNGVQAADFDVGSYGASISASVRDNYIGSFGMINDTNRSENYINFTVNDYADQSITSAIEIYRSGIMWTGPNRVLWAGTPTLLQAGQTVNFNYLYDGITREKASMQLNGIVLCWSRWAASTAYNDSWWYVFIPKWHAMNHDGNGVYMSTPTSATSNVMCHKYVYVYDDRLTGYTGNNATGTGYANNTRVLRAVLGV